MGKKGIILLLMLVMFISLASAETFRQGTPITIDHSVVIGGSPVNASCNLTVSDPRSNLIINGSPMDFEASIEQHIYTLQPADTRETVGVYQHDITCAFNEFNKTSHFSNIEVTPNGTEFTVSQSLLYIFVLIFSIALFGFCIWGALKINPNNVRNVDGELIMINHKKHLKHFLIIVAYLLFVWITFVGWNITLAYLHLGAVSSFFWFLHRFLFVLSWPFIMVFAIVSGIIYLRERKLEQLVQRGIFPTR